MNSRTLSLPSLTTHCFKKLRQTSFALVLLFKMLSTIKRAIFLRSPSFQSEGYGSNFYSHNHKNNILKESSYSSVIYLAYWFERAEFRLDFILDIVAWILSHKSLIVSSLTQKFKRYNSTLASISLLTYIK